MKSLRAGAFFAFRLPVGGRAPLPPVSYATTHSGNVPPPKPRVKAKAKPFSSVQFIYASRPSTKYFIRNTGTGSDCRSCHLRHCPHKFTQNNKMQMKHHSKNTTKNIHSKDSYSAVNSPHINTFWKHFHCQKSIPNCV